MGTIWCHGKVRSKILLNDPEQKQKKGQSSYELWVNMGYQVLQDSRRLVGANRKKLADYERVWIRTKKHLIKVH